MQKNFFVSSLINAQEYELALLVLATAPAAADEQVDDDLKNLVVEKTINWNDVLIMSLWHKVSFVVLHRLLRGGLISVILREGSLGIPLLNHWKQLYEVNAIRTKCLLSEARKIQEKAAEKGISLPVAKGGPILIPDCYDPAARKMYDVDFLGDRHDIKVIEDLFAALGYEHGHYSYETGQISALPENEYRNWVLHSRGLPNFIKTIPSEPVVGILIAQVQFVVGSKEVGVTVPAADLLRAASKKGGYFRLSDADILIQLCLHLARETKESAFSHWGMDWNLIKLSDLARFIQWIDAGLIKKEFVERCCIFGMEGLCLFALTATRVVFPSGKIDELIEALAMINPGGQLPTYGAREITENLLSVGRKVRQKRSSWDKLVGEKTE